MLDKVKNWYGRYERPISSISLIGGFVFDALTLKRVDLFWENLWVVGHLVIIAVAMVIVHAIEKEEGAEANPSKAHFWLVNIIQFFFGGILSTYLVFYFRSSDITVSWPFLFLLALCFWANEALKRHFVRLSFQVALLFLSFYCFAIFLVPVLLHKIGAWMFILSGVISLAAIAGFLWLIRRVAREEFEKSKKLLIALIAGIFILVNILYFTDLIPPIPLSLKDAGVYHEIQRTNTGSYAVVTEEESGLKRFFTLYPDYHKIAGEPVVVYSAIFSPPSLDTNVVHEWQYKDAKTGEWKTATRISLHIVGGRDGGFRTFSRKTNPTPGHWRVNVLTTRGQLIGRIRFNVVLVDSPPVTVLKVND